MKKEPLVSVITPAYNRANVLPRPIESVLKQAYNNWELIVIDDGSKDNTGDLVKEYSMKDERIKYISSKLRKGPGTARNSGMRHARGKYIAFLDSDDEWYPHHLKESIEVMESKDVRVCVSLWREKGKGKHQKYNMRTLEKAIKCLNPIAAEKLLFFDDRLPEYTILNGGFYPLQGIVIRKDILKTTGLMNEKLLATQDVEFMFRVIMKFNLCLIRDYHYIWHEGDDNIFHFKGTEDINNPGIVDKLNFHRKYFIRCLKAIKEMVRTSKRIRDKQSCTKKLNSQIEQTYKFLGKINKKNKVRCFFYFLCYLYYVFLRRLTRYLCL